MNTKNHETAWPKSGKNFGVINQMSGMLAHEVQQPLMAINNYLAGLRVYLNSKRVIPMQ